MKVYDLIVIGGGAAGFFTALNVAENNPSLNILILEKSKEVLSKVKVSGGGRCNVTHAEFMPNELVKNYPRGEKELRGPFHTFMTGDTMEWFEKRGVSLKIEDDGRVFPVSNSSKTIIDCFLQEASRLQIDILKSHTVNDIKHIDSYWKIITNKGDFEASKIMIATGSSAKIWKVLNDLGHEIQRSVPSLFTFHINDQRIKDLPGISTHALVNIKNSKLSSEGALLITHWGMSGPAILKLSAWGAIELHDLQYQFEIIVNWLPMYTHTEILTTLKEIKELRPKQQIYKNVPFDLPKRLWQNLVIASNISSSLRWADSNKSQLQKLAQQLCNSVFEVRGKSTFKEEFVTAGGIDLKEINFKTYESKKFKNLYFAGEILNIDAITGGFNFQNAWTGGYIAAQAISS